MTRTVLSLSALLGSIVLLVSGNTFLVSLLGVRLGLSGIEPAVIGFILVFYSIGFVAGSLYCNRIIERVGHIRSFAVFAALMAIIALSHPLTDNLFVWAALRSAAGLSMAGLLLVIESWFSTRASNQNRATLFAVYQMMFYLSASGGQLLVSTGAPDTFRPFSIAAMLLSAALIPLALTRMEAPSIDQSERMSFKALYKISPLGLVASLLSGVVISAFNTIGPVYGTRVDMNLQQISIFMASSVIAAMALAWPLGWISDRFDRREVLKLASLAAGGASLAAAAIGPTYFPFLLLATGCFVGFSASVYPIAVAVLNDKLHSRQIVAASAGLLLSYGFGSCIGPVMSSTLVSVIGPEGLFVGNALCLFGLGLYTSYHIRHSKKIPVQAQETFVTAMPLSTPVIGELDPRNEEFTETPPEGTTADVDLSNLQAAGADAGDSVLADSIATIGQKALDGTSGVPNDLSPIARSGTGSNPE